MSASLDSVSSPLRRLRMRVDPTAPALAPTLTRERLLAAAVVLAIGVGFALVGGGSLDLGHEEAKLGLAAREGVGPYGQVYGGWEPGLWPLQVLSSQAWAWVEGGTPSAGAARWPAAIAGVVIGLLLARQMGRQLGNRAGVWMALCWFGSVALLDRSAGGAIDLVAALGVIGALNRILGKGSDWVAGLWAGLAFLGGGWTPLAVIVLATVVIGRQAAPLSFRLVLPAIAVVVAWSVWALAVAPAEVWAAALTLPLTQRPDWFLAPSVLALGLPWSPLAALLAFQSVRAGWSEAERSWVLGWLQVAGACLLAGTIVPGLASSARLPALAGLAVAAAAVCDRVWTIGPTLSNRTRRTFLILACGEVLVAVMCVTLLGGYLAAAVSYYRGLAIVLVCAGVTVGLLALEWAIKGNVRGSLIAVVALAITFKVGHWGYYVPEWNYRCSQGPWGRAIGQWVPPNWPIYTLIRWPDDLAFATERPMRLLADSRLLKFKSQSRPQFLLLHPAEFEHWPEHSPKLVLVRAFQDERGGGRVLARTEGSVTRARADESD